MEPPPEPLDDAALGKLIDERIEKERAYLKFAKDQAKDDREYFKHLFDRAVWFIGAIVLAAGFFGFRSFEQLKSEIDTLTKAEMQKAQAELQTMRTSVQQTTEDLKSTSKRELDNVRVEVQKRVNDEFKSENITALVAKAAKERTEKELKGTINNAVEAQTKLAVHNYAPLIEDYARQQSQLMTHNFLEPVQFKLEQYGQLIDVDTLASLARTGDRKAFDSLDLMSYSPISTTGFPGSSGYEVSSPAATKVAAATVSAIKRETLAAIHITCVFRAMPISVPR